MTGRARRAGGRARARRLEDRRRRGQRAQAVRAFDPWRLLAADHPAEVRELARERGALADREGLQPQRVRPGAAIAILVALWTRLRSLPHMIAVFAFLAALPAVVGNNLWWHPDALLLLLVVATIAALSLDRARLGRWFYAAALAGGDSGPGVVPGDPDSSVVVLRMEAGAHPAVLPAEDLARLREWIAAGATEN